MDIVLKNWILNNKVLINTRSLNSCYSLDAGSIRPATNLREFQQWTSFDWGDDKWVRHSISS